MKFDTKKTVFLIDGSSFLYRAYYSMRPLHTPAGEAVQAVYGFCRMIKKVIDTFSPEHVVLVWDSKGKTTRHELFQEYKATRQAPPSDLFQQKEYIIRFADDIGLKQVSQQGIEADDIMYSLAQERVQAGDDVVFITSDKDMAQALNDHVVIYDTFKDKITTAKKFLAEHEFPVEKLPFYYALLGDASDNIPGVRGIGKTGAAVLVKQFASLDDLYERLTSVENKRMKTALGQYKDNAYLSLKLFLLQYHPTGLSKLDTVFEVSNWSNARTLFQELNFKSLLQEMATSARKTVVDPDTVLTQYDFRAVTTQEALAEVCAQLEEHKEFAMDTETTGLSPQQDPIVGLSLCVHEGVAYYIPFGHTVDQEQLSREYVLSTLKPYLENAAYKKFLHNIKFDALVLRHAGIVLKGAIFDTMVVASLLTPEWQRNSLKALSEHFFNEPMLSFDDVVKAAKRKNFSEVPLELAARYAAADAHQTLKLKKVLEKELAHETKIAELYHTIEHRMIAILQEMEATGIALDVQQLHQLDERVTAAILGIENDIITLIGQEHAGINLNSPKQIEELLFVKLQLPPQKKSAKGTSYSTDQEVLEILATMHPVPKLITRYRELAKLKSTYIDALPTYVNAATGCIHTTYNQVAVATGRLASSDPNLQNIPADTQGYGIEIRAAFKPGAGRLFLSADYSQIELRVLAHLSGDVNLITAFLNGRDIHAETASRLFDVSFNDVTHEQRQVGKRINFSILYGLTPFGLSKDLGISYGSARTYIEKYFAQYPRVLEWMEETVADTKKHGYVQTYWGRRRYIPAINERNKSLYEEARRVAINTRAQGTAAEIMKIGMINLKKALDANAIDATMVLQIHDELLLTVPVAQQAQAEQLVKATLEQVVEWKIPLQVTTRLGSDWKEVTK